MKKKRELEVLHEIITTLKTSTNERKLIELRESLSQRMKKKKKKKKKVFVRIELPDSMRPVEGLRFSGKVGYL